MTLIVDWNGREYDIDPTGFSTLELHEVEERTGLTWGRLLTSAMRLHPDAVRALFWTVDRRGQADLKYSTYAGPPIGVIMPHIGPLAEIVSELGKALKAVEAVLGEPGSDASPSDADTPPTSSTD